MSRGLFQGEMLCYDPSLPKFLYLSPNLFLYLCQPIRFYIHGFETRFYAYLVSDCCGVSISPCT